MRLAEMLGPLYSNDKVYTDIKQWRKDVYKYYPKAQFESDTLVSDGKGKEIAGWSRGDKKGFITIPKK